MTYYIFIQNNEIIGKGQAKCLNDDILNIEVPNTIYDESDKYIFKDGTLVLNPNYETEQKQKQQSIIDNLTMTPLDFIGVLQTFGLTLETINSYLESNLNIKMQLQYCNSVYCGVVKQFMPLTIGDVTVTKEMVESAFKAKNGVV